MSLVYFKLTAFFISLTFAALFAFLETALTALRIFKIKELALGAKHYAKLFEIWEAHPQRILVTILIANNFVHVLASVTITDLVQHMFGDTGLALAAGVATATTMILVFGEIIPKSYAKTHHEHLVGSTLWIINLLFYLLYPVVSVLMWLSNKVVGKLSEETANAPEQVSEKEIEFLIGYSDQKGIMESEKTEMLQNIFALGQTSVKEIMIPITDMVALDVNSSLEEAMQIFSKYRFTRIPVFEAKEDNIIGLIHQKDVFDLLFNKRELPIKNILMPILFVPEVKRVNQLLHEFLEKRNHMAILVDEHGSVTGLVTLEDILEEIVGEISDEHESVHPDILRLEEGGWMIDAKAPLDDIEEALGFKFDVTESVTLGGFLAEQLQHLPKKGERVFYKDYCFQIQRATSKRVQQVLVFKDQASK